jgi:hypothetical protein
MGFAIVIVAGLCLMTAVAAGFDYLGKKNEGVPKDILARVEGLERELEALRISAVAKDERIGQLETEMRFLGKLIGDGSPGGADKPGLPRSRPAREGD